MRSFTLAFVSTLLLSPISVLATYGEYEHRSDQSHHSDVVDHMVKKRSDVSTSKIPSIAVTMVYLESDVNLICDREWDICLEKHNCPLRNESCEWKNMCHEKWTKCMREYKCNKDSQICHKKTSDRDGFRCHGEFYNQAKILAAATAACDYIQNNPRSSAPLDKAGNFLEWPITRTGPSLRKLSKAKRRLVITMDCAVVGALDRHTGGDYTKCKYERE